jgi:hypothetical protein
MVAKAMEGNSIWRKDRADSGEGQGPFAGSHRVVREGLREKGAFERY